MDNERVENEEPPARDIAAAVAGYVVPHHPCYDHFSDAHNGDVEVKRVGGPREDRWGVYRYGRGERLSRRALAWRARHPGEHLVMLDDNRADAPPARRRIFMCFSWAPQPSSRTEAWKLKHTFTLAEALYVCGVWAVVAPSGPDAPPPLGYATGVVALGASAWGAEEAAPDGSRRATCACGHPSQGEALACGVARSTPAVAEALYAAYSLELLGPDSGVAPPFRDVAARSPRGALPWLAVAAASRTFGRAPPTAEALYEAHRRALRQIWPGEVAPSREMAARSPREARAWAAVAAAARAR